MKKAQKKNDIERLKELQIKLQEQEDKNLKIKDKRENKNNSYKLVIKRKENVKFLIIIMIICAFTRITNTFRRYTIYIFI